VVDWPAAFTRAQKVEALVKAAGLDPFQAEQRIARPDPIVIARLSEAAAASAGDLLHGLGVTAFVLSDAQLDSAPKPILLKHLEAAEGAPEPMYMCEPWRAGPFGLICSTIFLIVRARLVRQVAGEPHSEQQVTYDPISGVHVNTNIVRTTESHVDHVMDLWLHDGRRLRIDGQKFNFDVLGAERAPSDLVSCDRLALMLARQSPRALIDTSFSQFSAPPGTLRLSGRHVGLDGRAFRRDSPVFEFYTIWAAAMYRRLLGRTA
jgi:hypothetical protein